LEELTISEGQLWLKVGRED